MKKFKFRFQNVLDLRLRHEKEALSELAMAQNQYQIALEQKRKTLVELDQAWKVRESLGEKPRIHLNELLVQDQYIAGIKQRILQSETQIFKASKKVEKKLRQYLQRKKQTRSMESLEERERLEFKKGLNRKEAKAQDEMVVMRSPIRSDPFGDVMGSSFADPNDVDLPLSEAVSQEGSSYA